MGYKVDDYPVKYEDNTQGDPFDTLADISAVMQDLGWKPTISPHEGIRITLEAFQ